MNHSFNLVGALDTCTQPMIMELEQMFQSEEVSADVTPKAQIPGLLQAQSTEPDGAKMELSISDLKATYTELRTMSKDYDGMVVPTSFLYDIVKNTRMLLLMPQPDNRYILPRSWKQRVLARRSVVPSTSSTAIRSIDPREAYPNGVVVSAIGAEASPDFVVITLPEPGVKVRENMEAVAELVASRTDGKLATLADPRSIGLELHMAKTAPLMPRPPMPVDPGLVYVVPNGFSILFPHTFYHLSLLELGLMEQIRRAVGLWEISDFFSSSNTGPYAR